MCLVRNGWVCRLIDRLQEWPRFFRCLSRGVVLTVETNSPPGAKQGDIGVWDQEGEGRCSCVMRGV